jgi:hypothetical protein
MRLQDISVGDEVVYIPKDLLMGDKSRMVKPENLGSVTSVNDKYAFVRYKDTECSQATRPEDLYTLKNRPDLAQQLNPSYDILETDTER